VKTLKAHHIPLHVAHPNKVRNFAKATGNFAKTDKLDAKILSDYATVFKPKPKPDDHFISSELQSLKDLQIRKKQLLDDLARERNRLDKNISKDLCKSINRHISWLEKELKTVHEVIDKFIAEHETVKAQVDLITSIPGVGQATASAILTDLPEINTLADKKLVALAGLAPMNRDSGTKNGKRFIAGGRAFIRASLYMATISSIKHNHLIKKFYQKLRAKGKPAKVAIVAAMHKLLLVIKSVINRQSKWVENM
jgi:transposase